MTDEDRYTVNIKTYMDLCFKRIDEKIDKILDTNTEIKRDQRECENRCSLNRTSLFERVSALENDRMCNMAIQTKLNEMEQNDIAAEKNRDRKREWFWIKFGSFLAVVQVATAYIIFLLSK